MDAQSKSLEGTISNLKDTLGQNSDAVAPIMPFIKEGIGKLTESLPGVVSNLKGFSEWLVATGKRGQGCLRLAGQARGSHQAAGRLRWASWCWATRR